MHVIVSRKRCQSRCRWRRPLFRMFWKSENVSSISDLVDMFDTFRARIVVAMSQVSRGISCFVCCACAASARKLDVRVSFLLAHTVRVNVEAAESCACAMWKKFFWRQCMISEVTQSSYRDFWEICVSVATLERFFQIQKTSSRSKMCTIHSKSFKFQTLLKSQFQ